MADGEVLQSFFADVVFDGKPLGRNYVTDFEWVSFMNGGYTIRAKVFDVGHQILNRFKIAKESYLQKARKDPLEIKFKLGYTGGSEFETNEGEYLKAIISDITIFGDAGAGTVDFVAIDPPSWYLNAGKSDGKVFTGKISKVIEDVINEATDGKIKAKVSETKDSDKGKWGMHRQDPKTFIESLLDWSSKTLNHEQSSWIIAVDDDTIYVQDQVDSMQRKKHIANYNCSANAQRRGDIMEYATLGSTLITAYQTKLTTQGISAVSGKFIDKQTDPSKVEIEDKNTSEKLNAKVDQTMSFNKPQKEYSTSILAIPEFSGGELGLKYDEWVGGRPQQLYISMLPMIMRCRFTVRGDYRLFDNKNLGVSTIKVTWKQVGGGDDEDFFLYGRWIVYGFRHRLVRNEDSMWYTDIYAYRIDHDANAKPL